MKELMGIFRAPTRSFPSECLGLFSCPELCRCLGGSPCRLLRSAVFRLLSPKTTAPSWPGLPTGHLTFNGSGIDSRSSLFIIARAHVFTAVLALVIAIDKTVILAAALALAFTRILACGSARTLTFPFTGSSAVIPAATRTFVSTTAPASLRLLVFTARFCGQLPRLPQTEKGDHRKRSF